MCVPPAAEWISDEREGLTICDATSAIFGVKMAPWHKLDVVTFSWQKVLGGEGAHGILILSPRAVERLESWSPEFRPIPKIFRLTSGSPPKLIEGIFRGETINTPSMLCVEDYLDALEWVEDLGGIDAAIAKTAANYEIVEDFVKRTPWAHFLCENPKHRSKTSVCLTLDAPAEAVKRMQSLLEDEGVAFDIGSYRDAPPGLRIWCGCTVEAADLSAMLPWLEWAYTRVVSES